jgi:adenosine deaminase
LTGAVAPDAPHPIAEFDRRGVICTIDADDPALFSTTLETEYRIVAATCGSEALARFAGNAIDASFAAPERKAALRRELDDAVRLETNAT